MAVVFLQLSFSEQVSSKPSSPKPRLTVLDFVDLNDQRSHEQTTDLLREELAQAQAFELVSRDTMISKFREFNATQIKDCNHPQCAFDAGNFTQSDFVLFGTYTPAGPIDAITLKLLDVKQARLVWTRVSELSVPVQGGTQVQRTNFKSIVRDLVRTKLNTELAPTRKIVALVDLSDPNSLSRIFYERVTTRVYGVTRYDLMSPAELQELLGALDINRYSVIPSVENMVGLGQKLGVSTLVYSRLYRDGKNFFYRLAMYDIEQKILLKELPPQPQEDFVRLLEHERVFFNTLFSRDLEASKTIPRVQEKKSNKALWISLGVLGVGGGVAALWLGNLSGEGGTSPDSPTEFKMPLNPPEGADL